MEKAKKPKNTVPSKRLLKIIREKAISFEYGEYYPDVHAMGAPIFNSSGKPIAAVVMRTN